ncbi:MAG: hypothetical protein LBJ09_00060 [Clostridiales bacterium]|jgi:hypothetical protein|nr:hypothetical protein [Clostridiales bacterium]
MKFTEEYFKDNINEFWDPQNAIFTMPPEIDAVDEAELLNLLDKNKILYHMVRFDIKGDIKLSEKFQREINLRSEKINSLDNETTVDYLCNLLIFAHLYFFIITKAEERVLKNLQKGSKIKNEKIKELYFSYAQDSKNLHKQQFSPEIESRKQEIIKKFLNDLRRLQVPDNAIIRFIVELYDRFCDWINEKRDRIKPLSVFERLKIKPEEILEKIQNFGADVQSVVHPVKFNYSYTPAPPSLEPGK